MAKDIAGRGAGDIPGARPSIDLIESGFAAETGLAQGTQVVTLDGILPVEYLGPGDRIVTRGGMRVLRAVHVARAREKLLRVAPGTLGHDRPDQALILGGQAQILLRGWRAQAMFGRHEVLVDLARLRDGVHVTRHSPEGIRLFTLRFDNPEVIYAEGVEVGARGLGVEV